MPQDSHPPVWRFLVDENLPAQLAKRLQHEGWNADRAYNVGLRGRPDSEVFAYAQENSATLITQDHDLERDIGQFPSPHSGIVIVELPQAWPRDDKIHRIVTALYGLTGQSLSVNRRKPPNFRHGEESRVARKGHDGTDSCRFLAYRAE